MKFCALSDSDVIRLGTVIARFCNAEVIESSQHLESTSKSRFYVPATEPMQCYEESQESLAINIPATQSEVAARAKRPRLISDSSSGTVLDVVSDCDDKSSDAVNFSQNIFANTSSFLAVTAKARYDEDSSEDELSGFNGPPSLTSALLKVPDIREGSLTPDLDSPVDQESAATVRVKMERRSESGISQSSIATILNADTDEDENENPNSPKKTAFSSFVKVGNVKQEPKSQVRVPQSQIATQIRSSSSDGESKPNKPLYDFDTQLIDGESSMTKTGSRLMEPTQPMFMPDVSRTRFQLKRQAELKPKTVSLDEFDETQALANKKRCFEQETQPVWLLKIPKQKPQKSTVVNRILMSSDSEDSDEDEQPSAIASTQQESSPKTPKADAPMFFDESTPEMIPSLPDGSQLQPFLDEVNASQPDETGFMFHSLVEVEEVPLNVVRPMVQQTKPVEEPKAKRRHHKLFKFPIDTEPEPEAGPSQKVPKPKPAKKIYAIAMSNIGEGEEKEALERNCAKIGSRVVESIRDAELLLTSRNIKLTAKFLAAICKGIPIVTKEFILASQKAGKWLDPVDFIMHDPAMEAKKEFKLKEVLQKTSSGTSNFLKNVTVFPTSSTIIPLDDLKDIVEVAGGEFIRDLKQKPKFKNFLMISNRADVAEIASITKKYPTCARIKHSLFCNAVLHQKL